jgi:hypothetical protein
VRRRRVLTGVTMLVAAGAIATPASAASPAPWQPFRSRPFAEVCPFALRGDIVSRHELLRMLARYPDGSPQEQEFVGPLVIKYTNLSTRTSVERNLTGTGYFFFDPDGTIRGHGLGHIGIGIHTGNVAPPAGEYVLTGSFDFLLNPDGTCSFDVQGGTVEASAPPSRDS